MADERLGGTAVDAAVPVSLLHPRRRLLPPTLVELGAGCPRAAYPGVLSTREWASAVTEPYHHPSIASALRVAPGSALWLVLAHTACSVEGAPFEEGVVLGDANQRPRIARQHDNRAAAADRVHGTALVAELAQVCSRENGV